MQARLRTLLLAGVSLAFLLWAAELIDLSRVKGLDGRWYPCLFDDAMISMRYAWNLAQGNGLVWNPGERVEGFTNLLMTLVMALPLLLVGKATALLVVQGLGVVTLLGTAVMSLRIGAALLRPEQRHGGIDLMMFSLPLLYYPLTFWTLSGQETGLLAFFVSAAMATALQTPKQPGPQAMIGVLLGLAYATRPDAFIPAVLVLGWRWLRLRGQVQPGTRLRFWAIESLGLVLAVLAITSFRYSYYGEIVPNTYTLKVAGIPLAYRIWNGAAYIAPFLLDIAPILALAVLGLRGPRRGERALALLLFSGFVAYVVWVGGDAWPRWRMTAPFVPVLLAAALASAADLLAESRARRWVLAPPLLVLVGCVALLNRGDWKEMVFIERPSSTVENYVNVNRALLMQRLARPDAVVAMAWAGAAPYYSGLRAIDLLGKCDRYIARLPVDTADAFARRRRYKPGHLRYDLSYSIGRSRPDFADVVGMINIGFTAQYSPPELQRSYAVVSLRARKFVWILVRKDSSNVRWDALWQMRAAGLVEITEMPLMLPDGSSG